MIKAIHDGETLVFSSGREEYFYSGIIGIDRAGSVYGGYDQIIDDDEESETRLTKAERVELAEFMIARWTAFRDK